MFANAEPINLYERHLNAKEETWDENIWPSENMQRNDTPVKIFVPIGALPNSHACYIDWRMFIPKNHAERFPKKGRFFGIFFFATSCNQQHIKHKVISSLMMRSQKDAERKTLFKCRWNFFPTRRSSEHAWYRPSSFAAWMLAKG